MNSCSYFEGNPAFISSSSSRKEQYALLRLFVGGRRLEHAAHVVIYIWNARAARGRDCIRNNELDWKDWTSCWFHTDYFITECLVSIKLTSFESRHFELSIDITPMSVCWVFAELHFILVTYFKEQFAETEKTESASCFSFFFSKPQSFVVIVSVHKKK